MILIIGVVSYASSLLQHSRMARLVMLFIHTVSLVSFINLGYNHLGSLVFLLLHANNKK